MEGEEDATAVDCDDGDPGLLRREYRSRDRRLDRRVESLVKCRMKDAQAGMQATMMATLSSTMLNGCQYHGLL